MESMRHALAYRLSRRTEDSTASIFHRAQLGSRAQTGLKPGVLGFPESRRAAGYQGTREEKGQYDSCRRVSKQEKIIRAER